MNQNTSQAAQAIIGARRLISFEIERDDGTVIRPFGAYALGNNLHGLGPQFRTFRASVRFHCDAVQY